jgi:CubicO group peptidase (beta-lactamase class C family)
MDTFARILLIPGMLCMFGCGVEFSPQHELLDKWSSPLEDLVNAARAEKSDALIVLENGTVVVEQYFTSRRPHFAMSATKSVVNLAISLLLQDGILSSIDQRASDFFSEWEGTEKSAITIRHLMNHTSGLNHLGRVANQGHISNGLQLELISPVGSKWMYNNNAIDLLALLFYRATGEHLDTFLDRRLWAPLRISSVSWIKDNDGVPLAAGEMLIEPIDLAKVGQLILQNGVYGKIRVIDQHWLQASFKQSQQFNSLNGNLWWRHSNVVLTRSIVEKWIQAGLPDVFEDKLNPALDRPVFPENFLYSSRYLPSELLQMVKDVLESKDLFDEFYEFYRTHPSMTYFQFVEEEKLVSAMGWLGNYLTVDQASNRVFVRMRAPTQDDYDRGNAGLPAENEFLSLPKYIKALRD